MRLPIFFEAPATPIRTRAIPITESTTARELTWTTMFAAQKYTVPAGALLILHQLCAALVPVAERAAMGEVRLPTVGSSPAEVSGDTVLLVAIALSALAYYSTFDAPLKRSALDCAGSEEDEVSVSGCEVVLDGAKDGAKEGGADKAKSGTTMVMVNQNIIGVVLCLLLF